MKMKKGFFSKLARDAIKKNRQMYFPYILTGSVMVMMFYILMSMLESPDLENIHGGSVLMMFLPYGCGVIGIFSLIFLFYTNSFLIRQRYREFGLYNILGMDKRNISRLMLWEVIYTAGISIITGLICGIAFSKAAELILLNILNAEISFSFHIGGSSIILTALIYLGIYIFIFFSSLIKVNFSKPLELMQSNMVGEKKLKCNWLFAFIGAGLLGYAYYLAVDIEDPTSAALIFFVAVIMVIIATYLLFISGSVVMCKLLQKNKRYYYKPEHFVSVSSMAYRMKRNGAGLASICILLTMVLVMLSSTASLYFGEEDSITKRYPNGINITYTFDTSDEIYSKSLETQKTIIEHYVPNDSELNEMRYAICSGQFSDEGITLETTHVDTVEYNNVGYLYIISISDYNNMMNESKILGNRECLLYSDRLTKQWNTFTMEYGEAYTVKEHLTEYQKVGTTAAMAVPYVYIVVNDVSEFTKPIAGLKNSYDCAMVNFEWILGFDCKADDEIAVKDALFDELMQSKNDDISWNSLSLESREEERQSFYELYGSLFFLGIMLSIVFLMAAVLIIYYKQISEGYEDQNRFEIMQKVGMTKRNIRKSINSQMLTVFFTPLILAGLHLGFAFPCISKILKLFAFDNIRLNVIITLACFAVFGIFYGIVYKITSGSYYNIVSGRKEQ